MTSFDYLTLDDDIEQIERGDHRRPEEGGGRPARQPAPADHRHPGRGQHRGGRRRRHPGADDGRATVLLVIQSTQKSTASEQAAGRALPHPGRAGEGGRPLAALRDRGDRDAAAMADAPDDPRGPPPAHARARARRCGARAHAAAPGRRQPARARGGGRGDRAPRAGPRPPPVPRDARPRPRAAAAAGAGSRASAAARRPPAGAAPRRRRVRARRWSSRCCACSPRPAAACCSGSGCTRTSSTPSIFSAARSGVAGALRLRLQGLRRQRAAQARRADRRPARPVQEGPGAGRDHRHLRAGVGDHAATRCSTSASSRSTTRRTPRPSSCSASTSSKSVNTGEQAAPEGSECQVTPDGAQSCTQTVQMQHHQGRRRLEDQRAHAADHQLRPRPDAGSAQGAAAWQSRGGARLASWSRTPAASVLEASPVPGMWRRSHRPPDVDSALEQG